MRRNIARAPRDRRQVLDLASPRDVAIWLRGHGPAASSRLGPRGHERTTWEGPGVSSWARHDIAAGIVSSRRGGFTNVHDGRPEFLDAMGGVEGLSAAHSGSLTALWL